MRTLGVLLAVAVAGAVLTPVVPSPARAQGRRIVVEDFDGPGAGALRSSVLGSLRGVGEITLVPRRVVDDAAARLGASMTRPGDYVAVARELSLSAFVSGRVQRGPGWRVTIQVRDASNGEIAGETSFAGRRAREVSAAVRRAFWRRMRDALRDTSVPEAGLAPEQMQALENEEPPPPDLSLEDVERGRVAALDPELFPDEEAAEEELSIAEEVEALFSGDFRSRHSPVEAYVGARGLNRGFRYVDDRSGMVRPYDMPFGPQLVLGGEWYPGAHLTNGALAHLGLRVDLAQSVLMRSAGPNDTIYPTSDTRWTLGMQIRIPLGEGRIGLSAAYGHHSFSVEAEHPRDPSPDIASVDYQHGRFGADTRIAMGDLTLVFDAAYLLVLDTGEIGESHWFPRTTAHGADASIGFIYPLGTRFQVRGSIDGRLYLLDFHSREDDARVVAGAVDRFLGATAALAWQPPPDIRD